MDMRYPAVVNPASDPVSDSDDEVDMCSDQDGADETSDGFVHVTRPLLTVRQFTDWVRDVKLPSADAVMQGRLKDDTIQALVSRRTFLRDLLASFEKRQPHREGSPARGGAVAGHRDVAVEESAWPRLWAQFLRDLPREQLLVDGACLSPGPDARAAQALAVDPGAYAAEVVMPCIRRFIASRLPPDAQGPVARGSASAAVPVQPQRGGIVGGLAWALGLSGSATVSEAPPAAHDAPSPYAASASVAMLPVPPPVPLRDDAAASARNSTATGGDEVATTAPVGVVEGYTRLVVLMSQQAVLALPLEILSAQFCSDHDDNTRLFVSEVARNDPRQHTSGMRITLDPTPASDRGAVLRVAKTFRVFRLADVDDHVGGVGGDETLFYVSVAIELDLLMAAASAESVVEDHVSLSWRVEAAADQPQPAASMDTTTRQPEEPAPPRPHLAGGSVRRRQCECLGASAGYHQPTCLVDRHPPSTGT